MKVRIMEITAELKQKGLNEEAEKITKIVANSDELQEMRLDKKDTAVLGHSNNEDIVKRPSLDCLGDQQRFFQDDHYGPDDRTVFYSNKNDNNKFGVFLVHRDDNNLVFMRVRSPGWILVNNVESGRYKEVSRQSI